MFKKFLNKRLKRNQERDAINIYLTVFLSAIISLAHKQNSDPWEQFKNEIKHKNRYFPKSVPIQDAIKSIYDKAIYTLENEKEIYRAQIISKVEMPQESRELFDVLTETPQLVDAIGLNDEVKKYLTSLFATGLFKQSVDTDKYKIDDFWGFNAKRSDAPPPNVTKAGRLNSSGIPCLYAAEKEHTAIVEVRPIIGQTVSVAKIETLRIKTV